MSGEGRGVTADARKIGEAEQRGQNAAKEVEEVVMRRVAAAALRAADLERRLKNARFVSEASERLAAEAVVGRDAAERRLQAEPSDRPQTSGHPRAPAAAAVVVIV